jgi:hypothetical protein
MKKIHSILLISLLIIGCITIIGTLGKSFLDILNVIQISQTKSAKEEQEVLTDISKRTGLAPNWLAIRTYVYCDLLKPGTPRKQVEEGLIKVGDYFPQWDKNMYQIDFKNSFIYANLSPLIISFEKGVVAASGAGEHNLGPRADCELEKVKKQSITSTP